MKVHPIINSRVIVAETWEILADVAERMAFNDVGALAVLDGGRVAGIVTERDITRAAAEHADLTIATAADYMTPDPAFITPDTTAQSAARVMLDLGVRHLPMIDGGLVVGMVSIRDVLAVLERSA